MRGGTPSYVCTIKEFIEHVRGGGVLDCDGDGYYSDGVNNITDIPAKPSDFLKNKIDYSWSHIAWFNR